MVPLPCHSQDAPSRKISAPPDSDICEILRLVFPHVRTRDDTFDAIVVTIPGVGPTDGEQLTCINHPLGTE